MSVNMMVKNDIEIAFAFLKSCNIDEVRGIADDEGLCTNHSKEDLIYEGLCTNHSKEDLITMIIIKAKNDHIAQLERQLDGLERKLDDLKLN